MGSGEVRPQREERLHKVVIPGKVSRRVTWLGPTAELWRQERSHLRAGPITGKGVRAFMLFLPSTPRRLTYPSYSGFLCPQTKTAAGGLRTPLLQRLSGVG